MATQEFPVMSWTARPDMSCEHVSPAWLDFTGCTLEEALGDGWTRGVHPEDLARWLDTCVRAFDARRPFEIEFRLRRRDGAYRWLLDRAVPRYGADGRFIGYTGVSTDIDERKRAELALARALERERRLRIATEEAGRARDASLAAALLDLELLSGVRVLVVDDDPQVRAALVKVLEVAGAETRSAAAASEALSALECWRPDVLVAGVSMARGDAYALIRAVRSLPAELGGCLRAAAVTANGAGEDLAAPLAAGYDAQLSRPVEPVALLATVKRLVQPARV